MITIVLTVAIVVVLAYLARTGTDRPTDGSAELDDTETRPALDGRR